MVYRTVDIQILNGKTVDVINVTGDRTGDVIVLSIEGKRYWLDIAGSRFRLETEITE